MNIVSPTWILWMALTVAGHWAIPRTWRDLWLIAVTAIFLSIMAPASALTLAGVTVLTFYTTRAREVSGAAVIGWVALVIVLLGYTRAEFMPVISERESPEVSVIASLGLSYYCLRLLHYVFERYKNTLEPHGLREFAGYMFFLPVIAAGPVHRFPAFLRDLWLLRWNSARFAAGLERVLYGYVKITFVANFLLTDWAAELIWRLAPMHPHLAAYFGVLKTGIKLYVLFSGYSDVAIGFALLLGFQIIENFNWPFFTENIAEFWSAWHISVSSWCRDYVFLPVVSLTRHPLFAALSAMVVLALWHEISPRYLAWGLYNGLGIAVWQGFQQVKPYLPWRRWPALQVAARAAAMALTFHFVIFGFVIVEEPSFTSAWLVYAKILGIGS